MKHKINVEMSGFWFFLFVIFLILKLTGTITWSWWWVFSPLWIPFVAAILTVFGCVFLIAFLLFIAWIASLI